MRRAVVLLVVLFALGTAVALSLLQPGHAHDVPSGPLPAAPEPAAAPIAPAAIAAVPAPAPRSDTSGWTSGVVRGDIQLAVSVLDRIQSITVEVVEARSAIAPDGSVRLPTRRIVPIVRGRGTPTFEVRDIPFSEHPYVVMVHSPGLNGSRAIVNVDAGQPLHEDLLLAITPGVAFNLLVRDQEMTPYAGLDIALHPIGDPAGRPVRSGRTDNFGALVLADTLAGEYDLFATQDGLAVRDPERIVVQPGSRAAVPGQAQKLVVERGVPVQVTVSNRFGLPIADAKVSATATDRVKLTVREATADPVGVARLPLLQAGTWHLTIAHEGFHLWDRQITVKAFQDPVQLDARLVPIAR